MHGGEHPRGVRRAFDSLGRKAKAFRRMDDAKHGSARRSCSGEEANPADRELEPVVVRDRCQTGGRAISFVALTDLRILGTP